MMDDRWNQKGSQSLQPDFDKSGIKKVTVLYYRSLTTEAKGKISWRSES